MTSSDRQANIRHVLAHASDDDIRDGIAFYHEFHGVAVVLHRLYSANVQSVIHAAGIIAALSPMNDWHSNVADAFTVARWDADEAWRFTPRETGLPRVRTTHPNRDNAVRIRLGEHPELVLAGRKVRAFYQCTAAPDVGGNIAIDRHLACAATGRVLTDHEISAILRADGYPAIEADYATVAHSYGLLAHQVASVVWFAWRRMKVVGTLHQARLRFA